MAVAVAAVCVLEMIIVVGLAPPLDESLAGDVFRADLVCEGAVGIKHPL